MLGTGRRTRAISPMLREFRPELRVYHGTNSEAVKFQITGDGKSVIKKVRPLVGGVDVLSEIRGIFKKAGAKSQHAEILYPALLDDPMRIIATSRKPRAEYFALFPPETRKLRSAVEKLRTVSAGKLAEEIKELDRLIDALEEFYAVSKPLVLEIRIDTLAMLKQFANMNGELEQIEARMLRTAKDYYEQGNLPPGIVLDLTQLDTRNFTLESMLVLSRADTSLVISEPLAMEKVTLTELNIEAIERVLAHSRTAGF